MSERATLRRYTELNAHDREIAGRELRLLYASSMDREHVAGVLRLIADGRRIDRRRGLA